MTVAFFIIWPVLLVFWLVMMLFPDPNWVLIGGGLLTSVLGMATAVAVAVARRQDELKRKARPTH